MIVVITGASGVGKTTIVKKVSEREGITPLTFHFDDIGLPDWSTIKDHKKWQRETTLEWIDRLVQLSRESGRDIIFEGSTESRYFVEGFENNNFSDYRIVLFDCDREVMRERLVGRGQGELYHEDMVNWLHYLRRVATDDKSTIIRTDQSEIPEIVDELLSILAG